MPHMPSFFFVSLCCGFYHVFATAAHLTGALERRCSNHYNFGSRSCRIHRNGFMDDECACLLDQIKCYPRSECNFADFEKRADVACMLPIFESIFRDNCAIFSEHMLPWHAVQLGLAWSFCAVLLVGVLVYFAYSTQNRNSRRWQDDGCITVTAFASTIVVAAVWIGGMASLFFIVVYIIAICFIYFGCIYGVHVPSQHKHGGSVPNTGNASSAQHGMSMTPSDENDMYAPTAPLLDDL